MPEKEYSEISFYHRVTSGVTATSRFMENTWINQNPSSSDKWLRLYAWFDAEWQSCSTQLKQGSHLGVVMTLILSGKLSYECCDGSDIVYQAGDFVIYRRNAGTSFLGKVRAIPGEPLTRLGMILFSSPALEALLDLLVNAEENCIHCSEPEKIRDYMLSIKREITGIGGKNDHLENLLFHLLEELHHQKNTNKMPEPLRKALHYISIHGYNQLSIGELSKAAGISKRKMLTLFHDQFGVSPGEYLIRHRIEYAKTLLRSRTLMVSEVARICGFCNAEFFSRMFKARTGMSPSLFQD